MRAETACSMLWSAQAGKGRFERCIVRVLCETAAVSAVVLGLGRGALRSAAL